MADSDRFRIAICSNSLGKSAAGHDILRKLEAAQAHGFDGVEIAVECLEAHAASPSFSKHGSRPSRLRLAAKDIFDKAQSLSLKIVALNPFGAYDGLADPKDVAIRLEEAELWCQLCQILQAPIFQIPSVMDGIQKPISSDIRKIAENLSRLGNLAQQYNLVVAYEAIAWGTHTNRWQQARDILALVDLPNVLHCLDTFHIAAKEAGDPFNVSAPIKPDGPQKLKESLDEMKRSVKPSEIGYLQLSDATVADPEQTTYPFRNINQPPFMTQSRNCRIFPCEPQHGGTLPALDVAKAVFDLGYTGWVSMEVFHTDLWKTDSTIPDEWAKRGMASWHKVAAQCGLSTRSLGS